MVQNRKERQWEIPIDMRGRLQASGAVGQGTAEAWDWVEAEYEALADTFLSVFGEEDSVSAPRPPWAPIVMPSHLRRLLPISGGWFHAPNLPVPRRVERWQAWTLFQRPLHRERHTQGNQRLSMFSDGRHVIALYDEHLYGLQDLGREIIERALVRTSLGRAEPLLAVAITEAEAELVPLRLSGTSKFNTVAGRFLPVLAELPTDFPSKDKISNTGEGVKAWGSRQKAWKDAYVRRLALVRHLDWLRRWQELEAAQGRALRRTKSPRFDLNDFTAYIKPAELLRAYLVFEAAISDAEEEGKRNLDFKTDVCLGFWYRTMLYQCGASWRDLRAIARRSNEQNGLQVGSRDGVRQDDKTKQKAFREIYGADTADSPTPTDYMDIQDHHDCVVNGREPWTPEYERAQQLWAARRHLARWGRMAMRRFPKGWQDQVEKEEIARMKRVRPPVGSQRKAFRDQR